MDEVKAKLVKDVAALQARMAALETQSHLHENAEPAHEPAPEPAPEPAHEPAPEPTPGEVVGEAPNDH